CQRVALRPLDPGSADRIRLQHPVLHHIETMPPPSMITICTPLPHTGSDRHSIRSSLSVEELDENASASGYTSGADDFGIKLAADPYFYYTLDNRHPPKNKEEEIVELKLQIAKQQKKLDALASQLGQCQEECEVLKAENAELVDKMAASHKHKKNDEGRPEERRRPIARRSSCCHAGPEHARTLQDENAALADDNNRLRVVAEVMRKSFKSYIKESRRKSLVDKDSIQDLNALLRQTRKDKNSVGSSEERTAETALETVEVQTTLLEVDHSHQSQMTWTIGGGVDIEGAFHETKGLRHSISMSRLQVEPREKECRRRNVDSTCHAVMTKDAPLPSKKEPAGELLVDFSQSREARDHSKLYRRWSLMM
ncbi:hypothetical protein ACHAWF_002688, partial [Thalassiosira exigua]